METETKTGTIITLEEDNGYGFIKPDVPGENIFFHATGVETPSFNELQKGDRVNYLEESSHKGAKAVSVVARN